LVNTKSDPGVTTGVALSALPQPDIMTIAPRRMALIIKEENGRELTRNWLIS
jgi:hypothetical protein